MFFYGMDITYVTYVLPFIVLSIFAQILVKGRFSHYNNVLSQRNLTGAKAAELLLRHNQIYDVKIAHVSGSLTDNYNPSTKILSLSDSTYNSTSIAAIGVAAHETGHAIQHARHYGPLGLRSSLVPAANIGSQFGPTLAIAGIIFGGYTNNQQYMPLCQLLTDIGILLFALAVLFYIITLPVEFNASRRALKILKETNTLDKYELRGARKVLTAAALTYVASALTAIGSLLRLIILSNNRRRRS